MTTSPKSLRLIYIIHSYSNRSLSLSSLMVVNNLFKEASTNFELVMALTKANTVLFLSLQILSEISFTIL